LPTLPKAQSSKYVREAFVRRTCCFDYDVRALKFEDVNYYSSDFIAKFCQMHRDEMQSLVLVNVHSNG